MSDYRIVYSDELYHYGVPGMRWGHRKREAKTEYRRRLGASLDKYDKTIERIEKPYKRGQTLSKKDQERERKALNTQVREADKAKSDYKKAKADIKAEKKEYKQSAEYKAKRAKAVKVGAAAAGTALAAYGTYKLNKFVRERNTEITIARKLIEANDDINLNMKNFDNLKRGRNNDTIKMLNDSFNVYAERTLREAESEGRSIAELHSFGEAAKNVYDDYRKRRR